MEPKVKLEEKKSKRRLVPSDIDLSDLDYLEYGDVKRVARDLRMAANYVSRVKGLKSFNVKILAALLKIGAENRRTITQK